MDLSSILPFYLLSTQRRTAHTYTRTCDERRMLLQLLILCGSHRDLDLVLRDGLWAIIVAIYRMNEVVNSKYGYLFC